MVISLLIQVIPIKSKWLFTIYTEEKKAEAISYISRLLLLFGSLFCMIALLPLLTDFRGLRLESFVVLAILSLKVIGYLTKKHVNPKTVKHQY